MGISCLFGHKWNGCKCERCGKMRDEGHDFKPIPGKCEEKCSICGKVRSRPHRFENCRCIICGEVRDSDHKWEPVPDNCEEVCSICGKRRNTEHHFVPVDGEINGKEFERCTKCGYVHEKEMKFKRYTGGGVCDVCNCSLNGKRAYIVPNHTFYTSRKYRNWVNSNGMNAMFGIITPDAEFDRREAMDHSAGSAVCEDCIHLFE